MITKMDYLQMEIVEHLDEIELYLHRVGLTEITKFTVIARDPNNPEMFIVVTNDNEKEIAELLLSQGN